MLRSAIERAGIDGLITSLDSHRLRILCYHGIWTAPGPHFGDKLFMSPEKFESRVALMRKLKLEVLPMREANRLMRKRRLPRRATVITIDDGWATTFTHMLPVLRQYGYPATIYVQTARIDLRAPVSDVALRYALQNTRAESLLLSDLEMVDEDGNALSLPIGTASQKAAAFDLLHAAFERTPLPTHRKLLEDVFLRLGVSVATLAAFELTDEAALREADRQGFEIALHTHTHSLGDFSADRIHAEIDQNRMSLARILGRPASGFDHFCWPSGDYTQEALSHLRNTGIELATSCDLDLADSGSDPLALPRILDGQSTTDHDFRLWVSGLKSRMRKMATILRVR